MPAALKVRARRLRGHPYSDIPSFPYDLIWGELKGRLGREHLTRADGEEFLDLARRVKIETTTRPCTLERANEALDDLRAGRFEGAA